MHYRQFDQAECRGFHRATQQQIDRIRKKELAEGTLTYLNGLENWYVSNLSKHVFYYLNANLIIWT